MVNTIASIPSGDSSSFFGQKVSQPGINVNTAADNELIYKNDYSTTLYYNSSGIPTVLLGLRTAVNPNEQGLYVSQEGVDVTQANDSQLIFNSNQDIFKIVNVFSTPFNYTSSGSGEGYTAVTLTHNLGYVPVISPYVTNFTISGGVVTGITAPIPYILPTTSSATPSSFVIGAYVTITSVTSTEVVYNVGVGAPTTDISGTIVTYVLQETVS